MWKPISQWLWGNRKALISTAFAGVLLELMFNQPGLLYWWLAGLAAVLGVGCWWVSNLPLASRRLWVLIAQLFWVSAAIVGFVIFNLVVQWQFQAVVLVSIGTWFGLFKIFEYYADTGSWPVRALPVLDFVDLLAFFFVGAALMMAGDFYSLPVFWIILGFSLQALFALALRFMREELAGVRRWLYSLVTLLIVQEIVWVASYWHRGVYLKTFFVSVVFYLIADFIIHYNRGKLTVKVALEYVGLVVAVLIGVLIVDGFLVLR